MGREIIIDETNLIENGWKKGGFILAKADSPQCISEFNESKIINCSSYLWVLEKNQTFSAVNLLYWTAGNISSIVQPLTNNPCIQDSSGRKPVILSGKEMICGARPEAKWIARGKWQKNTELRGMWMQGTRGTRVVLCISVTDSRY